MQSYSSSISRQQFNKISPLLDSARKKPAPEVLIFMMFFRYFVSFEKRLSMNTCYLQISHIGVAAIITLASGAKKNSF